MASLIWGIIFIATGVAAKFFVGRRKFYRRNVAGVEEFKGYGSALANTAFEKLLSIGGIIAIILGAMLLFSFFIIGTGRP